MNGIDFGIDPYSIKVTKKKSYPQLYFKSISDMQISNKDSYICFFLFFFVYLQLLQKLNYLEI